MASAAPAGRDWESWLQSSSGPASADEEQKRDRTEERIRNAIRASSLPTTVRIRVKGSYANNTNVRLDSDVDIDVEWTDTFIVDRQFDAQGASPAQLGYTAATPKSMSEFRREVEQALVAAFGSTAVDMTGDKAITVVGGSTTLDADIVPCQMLRRWDRVGFTYNEGVALFPRSGGQIDNWPQQHYDNGVAKNKRTGKRFKAIVRCLKRLENELYESGRLGAPVPGYLIECLAYNAPDNDYGHTTMLRGMREVLASLWNGLGSSGDWHNWAEINELKYLFRGERGWTRDQAFDFVRKVWEYMGLS